MSTDWCSATLASRSPFLLILLGDRMLGWYLNSWHMRDPNRFHISWLQPGPGVAVGWHLRGWINGWKLFLSLSLAFPGDENKLKKKKKTSQKESSEQQEENRSSLISPCRIMNRIFSRNLLRVEINTIPDPLKLRKFISTSPAWSLSKGSPLS